MSLREFAKSELKHAGFFDKDSDYNGDLGDAVMKLIDMFCDQGHSGGSAPITVDIFSKLAMFEPLLPLTGDDNEWMDVGGGLFQNIRCSRVFKQDGESYDVQGRIFREKSGAVYTNRDSRVPVTFPYMPTTEYVDAPDD